MAVRRIERGSTKTVYLAGLLTGLAVLTRTAGICLVLAGCITLATKRRFALAFRFALICMIFVLAWAWWVQTHIGLEQSSEVYYSAQPYRSWNVLFNYFWPEKLAILSQNALVMLSSPLALLQMNSALFASLLIGTLILVGFLRSTLRGFNVIHIFVCLYASMLAVLPDGQIARARYA